MRFHNFKRGDRETQWWSEVKPGDLVHSPGSFAWNHRYLAHRATSNMLLLAHGLLLCIACWDGPPDNSPIENHVRTFMCMSRHGIIYLLQNRNDED